MSLKTFQLYSIIKFVHHDTDLRSIVFTSSITSEGKSLLVSSFAIFLAQLGRKVLLIDGDLRKPRLHTLFSLKLEKGLSDLLDDDSLDYVDVANKIPDIENLDLISAGMSLTEPTILFSSPRLKLCIDTIHKSSSYDYILIDTPPSLVCSDASLITRYCSTSIYIITLRNVKKSMAIEALNNFTESNIDCLGILTNSTKYELTSDDDYSKAYSYYYVKSSMFNPTGDSSGQSYPFPLISGLYSLIRSASTPPIIRKTFSAGFKYFNKFKNWLGS